MVARAPNVEGLRVRVVRDPEGNLVGFQDPDQGARFISRQDAIERMTYSIEEGEIQDSFGNGVGVGSLALPLRGVSVATKNTITDYLAVRGDPLDVRPASNQEIIERTTFITKSGRLVTVETGFGYGRRYDPSKYGGRFRQQAAAALELPEGERLPTSDLKRAVAYQEILIRTTRV